MIGYLTVAEYAKLKNKTESRVYQEIQEGKLEVKEFTEERVHKQLHTIKKIKYEEIH